MKKAYFITIEGVEGVGKTTAIQFLKKTLVAHKIDYVATREPGGTPIAEEIRQVLLKKRDETMCFDTELLLMYAGRAQNVQQVVLPALQQGQWVLCDRFADASFAYQGGGRGISLQRIAQLDRWVLGDLQPDLTLLLDAPIAVGAARIKKRGLKDRIESEASEFFEKVRAVYLQRANEHPSRFRIIKADQSLDKVQQQLLAALQPLLTEE